MTSACASLGTAMLIYPKMAHGSILQVLLRLVSETQAAFIFFVVGYLGVGALIANGASLKVGPRIRSLVAVARSILWAQFTLSMADVSISQGFPSPMVFFFSLFTTAEIFISYRAVLDVRSPK